MHTAENRVDSADGITRVALPELIAMRARAGKPIAQAVRVREAFAGGHASAVRGRGMDYAESRIYQPGDDARNIDWRRTARSGKWHTKLFEAEREQGVLLVIDAHATMRFGTRVRYKSAAAACAAAWLAWTTVRGGDRIGALVFGPVRAAIDPQAGTRGALATLGALAQWDALAADAGADVEPLSVALARAKRLVTPGSRMWMLSDGWCVDAAATAALTKLARRAEVRVVVVVDALERELAAAGTYLFEADSAKRRVDLTQPSMRTWFREQMSQGHQRLTDACAAAGVACTTLATGDDPAAVLAPLWRRRVRRA